MNLFGRLPIPVGMSFDKNGLGTKLCRGPQRHSRVHTKFPRRIRSSRNHSSLMLLSANYNRLAFKAGIKQFFHGDEEGIHINVEDSASHRFSILMNVTMR